MLSVFPTHQYSKHQNQYGISNRDEEGSQRSNREPQPETEHRGQVEATAGCPSISKLRVKHLQYALQSSNTFDTQLKLNTQLEMSTTNTRNRSPLHMDIRLFTGPFQTRPFASCQPKSFVRFQPEPSVIYRPISLIDFSTKNRSRFTTRIIPSQPQP